MLRKKYKIKYKYCFSRVLDDKVHNEFVCESCNFYGSNMNNTEASQIYFLNSRNSIFRFKNGS